MLTLVSNITSKGIARIRTSDIFCLFCLGHVPDMWDLTSLDGGSNFRLLQWKHRLLTTGPPGKSRISDFLKKKRSRILYECSFSKLSSLFGNNLVLKLRGRYIMFTLLLDFVPYICYWKFF